MTSEPEARPARQAAEWGLSALLLSTVVLIMFPLMTFVILGCLIAAWESDAVQLRHIDFGVIGMYVVVYGLLGLGAFALGCGLLGVLSAVRRGQPFGLALAGTIAAVVALGAALVLWQIGNYSVEDVRELQRLRYSADGKRILFPRGLDADNLRREWESRMQAKTRLMLGIALLVLGLVMPAGTLLVAATDWPAGVKAIVGGILFFGLEIMMIPAAALMGKENFDRIVGKVKGVLKSLRPAGDVGRTRYRIGLVLFIVPILFGWISAYVPSLVPQEQAMRLLVNLGLDLTLVVSLFVLGGDFWDKLQALFVYDARVVFPTSPAK